MDNTKPSDPSQQIMEQHALYMLLFHIILRQDEKLRLDALEAMRRILQSPTQLARLPLNAQQQLRDLRDDLLRPAPPEVVEEMRQPPVRPVE